MIDQKTKVSVIDALKEIWGFRPYRNLFFVEMFAWLAVQVGTWSLSVFTSSFCFLLLFSLVKAT